MIELTGSGAITDQYLSEAEALKPAIEKRRMAAKERLKKLASLSKLLPNKQEVAN